MVYKIQLSTEDNVGEMAQLALQERRMRMKDGA